ncbi:hypothetical protein ACVIJ6_003638 [Bradyrhizobium sp. USDA 4369]
MTALPRRVKTEPVKLVGRRAKTLKKAEREAGIAAFEAGAAARVA